MHGGAECWLMQVTLALLMSCGKSYSGWWIIGHTSSQGQRTLAVSVANNNDNNNNNNKNNNNNNNNNLAH